MQTHNDWPVTIVKQPRHRAVMAWVYGEATESRSQPSRSRRRSTPGSSVEDTIKRQGIVPRPQEE